MQDKTKKTVAVKHPLFGFVLCGLAWGILLGAGLAHLPTLHGAYEFPSVNLIRYAWLCRTICPLIGFAAGIALDKAIPTSTWRDKFLSNLWVLFFGCLIIFSLLAPVFMPAY